MDNDVGKKQIYKNRNKKCDRKTNRNININDNPNVFDDYLIEKNFCYAKAESTSTNKNSRNKKSLLSTVIR